MHNVKEPRRVDPKEYAARADDHQYVDRLSQVDRQDAGEFVSVGVDIMEADRIGTFIQKDSSVIHSCSTQEGVEVSGISEAIDRHGGLEDYLWKNVAPDTDAFTSHAMDTPHEGYFIRAGAGVKAVSPVQSCLYISTNGFSQNVHNIVVAEEDSELHIITGCATAAHLTSGLHVGVSEIYIKKNARLTFTMIHDWGEEIAVRPRTVTTIEEGGTLVSNYVSMRPVGTLQMFPTTFLNGEGATARFNSILVAGRGDHLDVGSRIVLNAPRTRAEIISRGISSGGTIIARGDLVGRCPGIKAHLECKGLLLNDGLMHAIPELRAHVPDVEMSHEAAVGKIDRREIEYLMARGLDEEAAISTIVRGFLNVEIEGLPPGLRESLDKAISETDKDML